MKRYTGIKGKLDTLVGDYYRSRKCDLAVTDKSHDCKGRMEWAHLKTRGYLSTRWLLDNAFSLCSKAHFYFTKNPDLFTRWIDKNYPGRIDRVNAVLRLNLKHKDWQLEELYNNLKKQLEYLNG